MKAGSANSSAEPVKCVVWDLDNTIWDGTLAEDLEVLLRPSTLKQLHTLDRRGIVQSIASRNDPMMATTRLAEAGILDMFVCLQIGWRPKSESIRTISRVLDIGTHAIAFVDDDPYELSEVSAVLPDVRCIRAGTAFVDSTEFVPDVVTADAARRRSLYKDEASRRTAQERSGQTPDEFRRGLGLRLLVRPAALEDLARCAELVNRTHQLNSTGYTFDHKQLAGFVTNEDHLLLVAELSDRFGHYGTIGLVLIEQHALEWTIKLLLLSCRVLSRGITSTLINHVRRLAKARDVQLLAEMIPTERNRAMFVAFTFNGFGIAARSATVTRLVADLGPIPEDDYVTVVPA